MLLSIHDSLGIPCSLKTALSPLSSVKGATEIVLKTLQLIFI